jgi:sialate O-acetylesterase
MGTNVEPWTPPNGYLWKKHMVPLLPMTFRLALWDQGEADAAAGGGGIPTNTTYYAEEFPRMILGWRKAFEITDLPFFYVELCTEYGAENFWLAQRSATKLPSVGYAVTTDVERALHPPDKQDVADRLSLEIRRMVYGEHVVSRGPTLVSASAKGDAVAFTFSDRSLSSHAGIYVGSNATCAANVGHDSLATDAGTHLALNYTIDGATVTVKCLSPIGRVRINADYSTCFLYGPTGLPAPSVEHSCSAEYDTSTFV